MYNNYGEVGLSVKDMVDKFAAASAQHKQVSAGREGVRQLRAHVAWHM